MAIRLDDARIRVKLDIDKLEKDLDRVDQDREKKRKGKDKEKSRRGMRRGGGGAQTRGRGLVSTRSAIAGIAAGAGGAIAIASFLERFGPIIVREVSKLIAENFAKGGILGGIGELAKGFGIDLEKQIKEDIDKKLLPLIDDVSKVTAAVDTFSTTIEALKETADFTRNAALLGRVPGFEKLLGIMDETQQIRYQQRRFNRFLGRERVEATVLPLMNAGKETILRGFSRQ